MDAPDRTGSRGVHCGEREDQPVRRLVLALSGHVSREIVRHFEIFPALRSRGLSVKRTVEVLADIAVFQYDRRPP
ncbi:hypothetical protein AB5J56_44895 [Streptomyces sp. R21]|uniref:Uncharacterized protein n=1 Tax=Streptomyces sp. R21 TaxID=3238627 RepID=A0AB39PL08_9ACTN